MSARKSRQNSPASVEVRPSSAKPVDIKTVFEVPSARSIEVQQAAMARGMQEWFDSFNKSHTMDGDDEDETMPSSPVE